MNLAWWIFAFLGSLCLIFFPAPCKELCVAFSIYRYIKRFHQAISLPVYRLIGVIVAIVLLLNFNAMCRPALTAHPKEVSTMKTK